MDLEKIVGGAEHRACALDRVQTAEEGQSEPYRIFDLAEYRIFVAGTPLPSGWHFGHDCVPPSVAERITSIGGENRAEGPESFRRWLDNEIEVWGRVVRANNIKLD